ncbi:MAG: T9SS type A sorting domain-containing protein [Candidatus Electryonea clarkiae]|nr:T9SS type A sorting domain-containing protein [Candidatus Electryonea clarkiae]MDP8289283.1 T9SS type A sorting domain-containing protein [Candidatus Electryonea clarkiae]
MIRPLKILFTALLFSSCVQVLNAQPRTKWFFTDYMYLSDQEMTLFNEILWFWTADSLDGDIHSNSTIAIAGNFRFYGVISTSQDRFRQGAGYNPYFAYPPIFNYPEIPFHRLNDVLDLYEDYARDNETFFGAEDNLQGRLTGTENGWNLERWANGIPYDSSRLDHTVNIPYTNDWQVIFHDGSLQLRGKNITGKTKIASTENIKLIDNILVGDADTSDWYVPTDSRNFVSIYCDGKVVIADNYANGRGNGLYDGGINDHSRKHIIITAAIQAMDESFTFEHQNDDWSTYIWCDRDGEHAGEHDERGNIYLYGSLVQKRRGFMHRTNCGGTGYAKRYKYDPRWYQNPPLGIPSFVEENSEVVWEDTIIVVNWHFHEPSWTDLVIGPGTTIYFDDERRFNLESIPQLSISGEVDNPVRLEVRDNVNIGIFNESVDTTWNHFSDDDTWENVEIIMNGGDLVCASMLENVNITADSAVNIIQRRGADTEIAGLRNCELQGKFKIESDVEGITSYVVENCKLNGDFRINSNDHDVEMDVKRSIVEGRLSLSNPAHVINCVFYSDEPESILLITHGISEVKNSFFHSTGDDIYALVGSQQTSVTYSGSVDGMYMVGNVDNGDGFFTADPRFVNAEESNFHLQENSPLIDAGDPDSPRDPDGTIADVGVYPYYQDILGVKNIDINKIFPSEFKVAGPFPNPFNLTSSINVELPELSNISIDLFNLIGQHVSRLHVLEYEAGSHDIILDFNDVATGMYLVKVSTSVETRIVKAVLIK